MSRLPSTIRRLCLGAAALALAAGAGCGGDDGYGARSPGGGAAPTGDGRLLVAWTIDGAAPSSGACAAVDHLVVDLAYDSGDGVEIEPVPCALQRFRYDNLPSGPATIQLTAFDARGCRLGVAQADLSLGATLPASPSPTLALPALPPATRCR